MRKRNNAAPLITAAAEGINEIFREEDEKVMRVAELIDKLIIETGLEHRIDDVMERLGFFQS